MIKPHMKRILSTLCIIQLLVGTVFSYKTKSITITDEDWADGATFKQAFINQAQNLQLTPKIEKIISVDSEVIWDFISDKDGSIVSTGSEGKVMVFNQQNTLRNELTLKDAEITVIAKSSQYIYFGSGPEGKLFRVSKNQIAETKTLASWLKSEEQFIWDLALHNDRNKNNELWVATGGEQGKIFRISEDAKAFPSPTVIVAEPNITKLVIKNQGGKTYLYFGTSTQGKLYRLNISDIPKGAKPEVVSANLSLLFDAGDKDIADFTLVNNDIYVVTSGTGAISDIETASGVGESGTSFANEGGLIEVDASDNKEGENNLGEAGNFFSDSGGESAGENYLVHINAENEVNFLYRFDNKSPMRVNYLSKTEQLYIGILENAEIYIMPLKAGRVSRVEKIFSKPEATFSGLFIFDNQLYFTVANLGEIYRLQERLPDQGVYVSKVFDFLETVKWGAIQWENHNPGTEVKLWTRSGNSQKPPVINFVTGVDLIETENESTSSDESGLPAAPDESSPNLLTPTAQSDWSAWTPVQKEAKIAVKGARFLQFAVVLQPKNNDTFSTKSFTGASPMIKQVKIFYAKKNTPHRITALKFYRKILSPLAPEEFAPPIPKPMKIFDVYDADKSLNTRFSTSDKFLLSEQDPTAALFPFANLGKKVFVVEWKVENQDSDPLVFNLYYRRTPLKHINTESVEEEWILLKKDYINTSLEIDGYKFIDGIYQFKLVAHDGLNNPLDERYQDEAFSVQQTIDNQPPQFKNLRWSGDTIQFQVVDTLSIISSLKYTFDKETVLEATPIDGIYDSMSENFRINLPAGTQEVVIIAKDQADNIIYNGSMKP